MLREDKLFSFCGKDTMFKALIKSFNSTEEGVEETIDIQPCSGPNSVSIKGQNWPWPCLVVLFGGCGQDSVMFEPADSLGDFVTQCGDKKELRKAGDNCGDKNNQCWQIDFMEKEDPVDAFLVSEDRDDLLEPVAFEVVNTIEKVIKDKGSLNEKSFIKSTILKNRCKGNNTWQIESIP